MRILANEQQAEQKLRKQSQKYKSEFTKTLIGKKRTKKKIAQETATNNTARE